MNTLLHVQCKAFVASPTKAGLNYTKYLCVWKTDFSYKKVLDSAFFKHKTNSRVINKSKSIKRIIKMSKSSNFSSVFSI